ncbi:MAG: alpha/beta hydrolase [Spirochaetales bacterium]|uniref:Alpha/beta hydrolase n=1 Tax=Candidatus Thalassospirochaeta sargassi TaxID=3119039 RepID=A0AAJ1IAP0_9SPIO|nr:alpha/beta hydrolase [Spirochaetales bacterium]
MKLKRMKGFKSFRTSWLMSNRHYIIPLLIVAIILDAGFALVFAVAAAVLWAVNKLRARLPIETRAKEPPQTIVYRKIGGAELKLDLYSPNPTVASTASGTATVVFAHGGGWISGARNQPNNISWCHFLVDRGFAVASIDYRFAYANKMADIIDDFSAAVDFIRVNADELLLPKPLILMGLSAGGHLALCHAAFNTIEQTTETAEAMRDIKAVVAYYSPSDLTDLFSTDDKSFFARFGAGTAMKSTPRFDEAAYDRFSPVNSLSVHMIPVLAVHGRNDEVVPYSSSVKLVRRLKEFKIPCRFLVHKSGGHGFEVRLKDYRTTMILEETVRFMRDICR